MNEMLKIGLNVYQRVDEISSIHILAEAVHINKTDGTDYSVVGLSQQERGKLHDSLKGFSIG